MQFLTRILLFVVCLSSTRVIQNVQAQIEQAKPDSQDSNLDWTANESWYAAEFWTTLDGKPVEDSWNISANEIQLTNPRGGRGSLISKPLPTQNFQFQFDWKIQENTNSGVKYRTRKFGGSWLGIEYQLIDEVGRSIDKPKQKTGAIYGLFGPKPTKFTTATWHRAKIRSQGHKIQHFLDGQLIAEATTTGPSWQAKIARSKFYGRDGFGQSNLGDRIMLTDHGGKVSFRNFQFVAMPSGPPTQNETLSPQLGNGMRNGWADQNSIVIWTRTTKNAEMTRGPQFKTVKSSLERKAKETGNDDLYLSSQLADGKQLDEMLGACPGAAGEVRLTYFHDKNGNTAESTEWKRTEASSDFTAQWKLDGLRPGTKYFVVAEARPSGGEITSVLRGSFETAPAKGKPEDFTFCLTTCHDFERRDDGEIGHKIYPSMTKLDPDFVVHAGDIEYYDKPHPFAWTKELMRFKWARIFSMPRNREFYSTHTTYFIKDDHDTLKNDCWTGQSYGNVNFDEGMQLFNKEQFPSQDPRYATIRWGKDVQFWLLEGRDYRSPNSMEDGPEKSILGSEQKAWLKDTLIKSDAKFKLVFSPTPIVGPDRKNKRDNHANSIFAHEGEELRRFFSSLDNTIVFCGDRHWQYASVDAETGLWEFGCGPGSEKHQLGWKKDDVRPVHRFLRVAGGFLSGEVTHNAGEAKLTLRHHKVTGEEVSSFEFPKPNSNQ